jgi:hypothetical protein
MRGNADITLHSDGKLDTRTIPDHPRPRTTWRNQCVPRQLARQSSSPCCRLLRWLRASHLRRPHNRRSLRRKDQRHARRCVRPAGPSLRQYRARQGRDAYLFRVASKRPIGHVQGSESGTCGCAGQGQKLTRRRGARARYERTRPGPWRR